jgi:uncharacterized membrane protein SpoIIM required for sporulation
MVLERLISIRTAVKNPWWMFFVGAIVSALSLFIAFIIFPQSSGLFSTFLITFAMTPFMVNLITYEEAKEEELIARRKNVNLLVMHKQILLIYTAFFLGVIVSLSILFIILPEPAVATLFNEQITEINLIRGNVAFANTFTKIVVNNIGVLLVAFLFSFLFGAGAVFILAWNASVLAAAIGLVAKSIGGLHGLPVAMLTFFPHGSLEILAYFIGGIAGGLVSAAMTRRRSRWFWVVTRDSLVLMIIAVVCLIVAGAIETFAILL